MDLPLCQQLLVPHLHFLDPPPSLSGLQSVILDIVNIRFKLCDLCTYLSEFYDCVLCKNCDSGNMVQYSVFPSEVNLVC